MSSNYKHSESFAKLKSVNESIQGNLTSYQYLSVLDDFLYKAIFPLIESTRFVDVFLAQMLGWQTTNPKRKTSGLGRQAFSANTTLFLLSDNPKQKLKILKRMRLDRAILFENLRRWFSIAEQLDELGNAIATPDTVEEFHELQDRCAVKPGFGLTSTYRVSHFWYNKALDFKRQILEKYTRLCLMTAKRDYEDLDGKVELNDIVQIYLLTASKAIDKCDSERGVLTTHIQNWLMSAKNSVVSNYVTGSSHDVKSVNISTTTNQKIVDDLVESASGDDVEELSHSDDDVRERNENVESIRTIAKVFDPLGFVRLPAHIQEILSKEDRHLIHSLAVDSDWAGESESTPVNVSR